MRGRIWGAVFAALGLIGSPAHGQETRILNTPDNIIVAFERGHEEELGRGFDFIGEQQPAEAIAVFDKIIVAYETEQPDGLHYCSADQEQSYAMAALALMIESEVEKATILGPNWCGALFGKAFALVDLRRPDEAEPLLLRAVEMAPLNAHYRNELGELYKNRREWQRSFDVFEEAYDLAQRPAAQSSPQVVARSLRGMGYCKIEMGELDEASALFVRSQEHDPDNPGAKAELEYIASLRNPTS